MKLLKDTEQPRTVWEQRSGENSQENKGTEQCPLKDLGSLVKGSDRYSIWALTFQEY